MQSYLRGMQYEREKKKQGTNNQYIQSEKAQNEPFQSTAEKLAEQHNEKVGMMSPFRGI